MDILEAMKNYNLRLSNTNNRWMVLNEQNEFVVYEQKPYARNSSIVTQTMNEEIAVSSLIDE